MATIGHRKSRSGEMQKTSHNQGLSPTGTEQRPGAGQGRVPLYARNIMEQTKYWGLGVGFIGFFFLTLIEPSPDQVKFQCDRSNGMCIIERTDLFRTKSETIEIDEIKYAYYESFGGRGYRGPKIKLNNGNDISIGTGQINPFAVKEHINKINQFLSNPSLKNLSVTLQTKFPTVILVGLFLFGGIYTIYKALKPYILQGLNQR